MRHILPPITSQLLDPAPHGATSGETEMPQLLPQINPNVPEDFLADKLRDEWLPNDPKPRRVEMVRQSDGKWTRTYD
jgi:hypothetical protein